MRLNFFEKKYQYIGLHINMHAVKALQFNLHNGQTTLQGYTNATLSKGLIDNDTFLDQTKLTEFIKTTIASPQNGSFTTKHVVISVPESKSFVRVIEMTNMDDESAATAVMFEAESYIPLPIDQVYFDWQILRRKGKTMDVLVIASPKEYVDTYMHIIEAAGLKLCGIEAEAQSVTRALVPNAVAEPVVIVDMDAFKSALIIVENSALEFTSTVPIAGNNFTDRIVEALKITPEKAEKLKRDIGFANTVEYPNLKTVMNSSIEDLAAEIKNLLKFHYEHSDTHINQVLITGGGSKLKHMAEALVPLFEQYAPVQVTIANPLEHVPHLKNSDLTPYEALSFTTAIGLALWGLGD